MCPSDKKPSYWEEYYLQAWEKLVDTRETVDMLVPISGTNTISSEAFLLKSEDSDDGISGYTLPVSCYLKGLPELQASPADATNFKMRKHWERHIIPRIQDFVRSSFRSYEMEYFFEQLRQPLRNGDQQGASEVAHILCDQRLPSGVVLPDPKHDWNALVLDEAIVGKWFLARLKAKTVHCTDSVLFRRCFYQGVTDLPVICRAVDSRAAAVLVEYTDYDKLELHMCWIPISSLYHLETKIHSFGDDLPKLYGDLSAKVTGLYARQTLIECLEGAMSKVPLTDIISLAVWEELSEDRIEGWLTHRLDYLRVSNIEETDKVQQYIHQPELNIEKGRLHWVEEKVIPGNEPELVEWCLMTWTSIGEKIAESARTIDLVETVTALMGPQESLASTPENILAESLAERVVFPIHNEGTSYSGLILCFKKESFLCSNSVIQFYSDPEATEMIHEVRAGRQGRYSLPPIVFSTGKVWCTYYTFIDLKCSPYNPNFSGPTVLKCKVFGIPTGWTEVAWTTEALSATLCKNPNSDSISLMHSLLFVMTEFLNSSKAPTPVRQLMFRLMIRMLRRIRYMNSECPIGLGISEEWLTNLVDEIRSWRDNEFSGDETLFSSYVQDGVELIATALLPWDLKVISDPPMELSIPVWIQAMHKSLMILNYFRKEGNLPLSIDQEVCELLNYNQWSTVFILNNIQSDSVQEKILTTLSSHKLRVLNSSLDIQILANSAVIICDGLSLKYYQETDLGEEEKKEEVEEEVKQPEGWECAVCTFINPMANSACDMCTAAKPEVQVKVEAPKTDVRAVEKKLLENMQQAIKELCNSLESNLQCQVKIFNEEEDYSVIKAALRQRVCKDDGLNSDIVSMFDTFFDHLRPLFGDKPEGAKQKFIDMAQSDAYQLFKTLEKAGIDLWLQKGLGVNKRRLNLKQYEALMDFVEFRMCQETRASLYIPPQFIRLPVGTLYSINFTHQFPGSDIVSFTLEELRYNWAILKVFNRYISDCIGLCNLSHHTILPRGTLSLSAASALSQSRALVLLPIKVEMQQRVFAKTAVTRESPPKVVLERLKFQDSANKVSVFSKAFEQLKDISTAALRVPKPQGSDPFIAFEVVFKGEMVVGEAGPYRQFFADLSREIVAQNVVKLLCPSPNNREKFGESLDKFVINPSANSAHDLQLFEFLGILMGCCARTGARFTLDLPSYVWKPLIGQNLRFDDLVGIDTPVAEMLKLMENASEELFEESFENFCTRLSDETIVDLKQNGRFIPVTYENKDEYISAVLACRFSESEKQSQAIREGLSKLVPNALLNLVTWRQLEDWVCGKPEVDIDLLKRHTRYSGGLAESTPRITWFWEILNEFTQEERLKFIKFCWGQERLPGNDEDFERTNTRFMLKPSMNNEYGDGALPKADTCFFNLELPEYSSKEIMRDRIRFAILTDCESMNADNPVSEQQEAGLVRAEHFTDEEGDY
jgi:other hect domain ubiquitin protein ligase E3